MAPIEAFSLLPFVGIIKNICLGHRGYETKPPSRGLLDMDMISNCFVIDIYCYLDVERTLNHP
jgi:hypothetical protein